MEDDCVETSPLTGLRTVIQSVQRNDDHAELWIEPKALLHFPADEPHDDLIQFDIGFSCPGFNAHSADENSIRAFQNLRSSCTAFFDGKNDGFQFSGTAGAFNVEFSRHGRDLLSQGHVCMPFANWEDRVADLVSEPAWRFPATLRFAFHTYVGSVEAIRDGIDEIFIQIRR